MPDDRAVDAQRTKQAAAALAGRGSDGSSSALEKSGAL